MRTAMNLTLLMIVMLSLSVMMNAPLHAAANKVKGRPMLQYIPLQNLTYTYLLLSYFKSVHISVFTM